MDAQFLHGCQAQRLRTLGWGTPGVRGFAASTGKRSPTAGSPRDAETPQQAPTGICPQFYPPIKEDCMGCPKTSTCKSAERRAMIVSYFILVSAFKMIFDCRVFT